MVGLLSWGVVADAESCECLGPLLVVFLAAGGSGGGVVGGAVVVVIVVAVDYGGGVGSAVFVVVAAVVVNVGCWRCFDVAVVLSLLVSIWALWLLVWWLLIVVVVIAHAVPELVPAVANGTKTLPSCYRERHVSPFVVTACSRDLLADTSSMLLLFGFGTASRHT